MKQKTRILIYIIIAIAVVIMGTLTILKNHQADSPATAQEHIDLGRIYLTELSYEKASLEFTEAIEIEPLNSDAYLGLAEAYVGMGDTEKAIDILEEGYDKTGDERLKDMLEELRPPEETMVTTAVTTEETTTVSTVAMAVVPDLQGLTEEEAIAACETAGLNYSVSYECSDAVEKGYVLSQVIPVNASVAEGISVPFTVSKGTEVVVTVATTIATATTAVTTSETTVATTTEPVEKYITIGGKKYSTDLTELNLSGIAIRNNDIKELYKMKNLTKLDLSRKEVFHENGGLTITLTYIDDISVLSELTNLTYLDLSGLKIKDISPLSNLTNLTYLDLSNTSIRSHTYDDDNFTVQSSLTALSNLYKLEYLDLSDIGLGDDMMSYDGAVLEPLKNLVNLKHLNLKYNWVIDITPLSKLTKLETLDLGRNKVNDINALKGLTNLIDVDLGSNKISDISALKGLTNLIDLDLGSNKISDISALKGLTNLTDLDLIGNQISDISALKGLTNLTVLHISSRHYDIDELKKALPNCEIIPY